MRFMIFARFAIVVALFSVASAGAMAAKKSVDLPNAVNYAPLNPAIGPAPDIDPREYEPYRLSVAGKAELYGVGLGITLSNGTKFSCTDEEMFLYPDTRYTEWMIDKWALEVDGRNAADAPLYPGFDRDQPAPSWLKINFSNTDASNVVRVTNCHKGNFSFKNVPVGTYLFVSIIAHFGGSYSTTESSGESTTVSSPVGPVLVDGGSHIVGGGFKPSDDFVLISRSPVVVTATNDFYKFQPGGAKVIARRFER